MSFKLFDVEFDSDEPIEVGSKKMDKVCQIVGTKFNTSFIFLKSL